MEKHTVLKMMGGKGLELIKNFLKKEFEEKVLNKMIAWWDEF